AGAGAEQAKHHQPVATDAKELARAAARSEKQAVVAVAEEAEARAKLEVEKAGTNKKVEADKKLVAAKAAVAKARKDLEAPGENYTPFRGSLKTLENNLESE